MLTTKLEGGKFFFESVEFLELVVTVLSKAEVVQERLLLSDVSALTISLREILLKELKRQAAVSKAGTSTIFN